MSIRINNKIIAGNSSETKSTSYRYVGEIFQSAIPIDDIKVACLDGHKIYSDEGYGSFMQHLISQSVLYPQLVCTEEVWQEKVTQYGSWGQFVINTQENSVRLPKIAGFVQGLNTLEDLAGLLEAGLPNIEGTINSEGMQGPIVDGAFKSIEQGTNFYHQSTSATATTKIGLDSSLSNPIYGNSTTVQPQAIQYPYYIVLATGVVQEINVKKEVELNNPFFFGMYQYFETNPNNVSWLKSEGQWNNGSIYESFYEWLVNSYNDTESGVSVKLNSDTYTNFDYVLNQDDKTFKLPIEVKQKFYNDLTGDIPVAGNGMTLGFSNNTGLLQNSNNNIESRGDVYGKPIGTGSTSASALTTASLGITTDPTKSGIEAQITQTEVEGLGLYFYVGEVVQNANIINISKLRDEVKGIDDKHKSYITNCLTEIPQNIKLELKDGVLTLKKGSTFIVPNGFKSDGTNNFDRITTTQDLTRNTFGTGTSEDIFIQIYIANSTGDYLISYGNRTLTVTSDTQPEVGKMWHDTTNNKIYIVSSSGLEDGIRSFPFANISVENGVVTKIKQVFNSMGYFGNTIFVDKGVKCLIPNGRNEDGTLNNIEVTTSDIKTLTYSSQVNAKNNGRILINTQGNILSLIGSYNEKTNYVTDKNNQNISVCVVAENGTVTDGKIDSFDFKLPFKAVDYSDKQEIISWLMPDYTSGVSISTGWKATYDCIGYCRGSNGDKNTRTVAIDGVEVYHSQTTTYPQTSSGWWVVPKGSTVTFSGSFNVSPIVYPFKGTNQ